MNLTRRGHVPIRTCVACGAKRPKADLIRLGLDVRNNTAVIDRDRSMGGRGAHVCPECLPKLRFTGRVRKAFRGMATDLATDVIQ